MIIQEINKLINETKRLAWTPQERIIINDFCIEFRIKLKEFEKIKRFDEDEE